MANTHFTDKTRLYVQLRPDTGTLTHLQAMRSEINDGRPVPDSELHMTVIHIGELSRLIAALPEINSEEILQAAERCADELEQIAASFGNVNFALRPIGLETFGKTIAVGYEPSKELNELHRQALLVCMNMLKSVGISDPRIFMQNDPNLRNALTLHPHVALSKNASPQEKSIIRHKGLYSLMKVVY
ncbi:MAG: hypothetical protein WAR37_03845 [Candidatus Microsaccharimonas sp.]